MPPWPPQPNRKCDYQRIAAWKVYRSCVEGTLAKLQAVVFDEMGAFARCRHTYFRKWTGFQAKASLAGSGCIGSRFTDNGDQTVTDNLSGLVWEKKDTSGGIHDIHSGGTWSTGAPWAESGTTFTNFLPTINGGAGFAGANGWRLPTLAELQTIVLDFPCRGNGFGPGCSCPASPCIDPALDSNNTFPSYHWTATSDIGSPNYAWIVNFGTGHIFGNQKVAGGFVRAVRGGF